MHFSLQPWDSTILQVYSYKLDPYCLPSSVYPTIVFDSSLLVSLHWDNNPAISNHTLLVPISKISTMSARWSILAQSWISCLIPQPLHIISSNSMMEQLSQYQHLTWPHSFQSPQSISQTQATSYHCSFNSTPK
jgi:hypothetical protein